MHILVHLAFFFFAFLLQEQQEMEGPFFIVARSDHAFLF